MRTLALLAAGVVLAGSAPAQVAPVSVRVGLDRAWTGQRLPFFVELRATGSFAGTASFDLPALPGILLLKIGDPVVSSQDIEGQSWFVQSHEFALFSQTPGPLEVRPFGVRFACRDGFTGPVKEVRGRTPGFAVEIRRPPGSDRIGFIITTESLDVAETWEPGPGPAEVGAMVRRTIVQRAAQVSGMALAPAPTDAPPGVRVYPGPSETNDRLERGDFLGERRETITYLLTQAGTITLPALTYMWWNPTAEQLQSRTLPAVTFEVAPRPAPIAPPAGSTGGRCWPWLPALALAAGLGFSRAPGLSRLVRWGRKFRGSLDPPERVAARRFLRACVDDDAAGAQAAWVAWRNLQAASFEPDRSLRAEILGLQRHLFGSGPVRQWQGSTLARAFSEHLAGSGTVPPHEAGSTLPPLNPPRGPGGRQVTGP
ncbi:MAG: BatD family protein [Candidatus Riflebacteria bacterium]|nr:BatD family protein [Candidatus Riflebacteria bacterium]